MGMEIADPTSNTDLLDYSPPIAVSSVNIPTFILHGLKDVVVPHQNCRDNVASLLNANGGLLAQNNVCHNTAMPSMGSNTHLERLYSAAGHGMIVLNPTTFKTQMFNRVRSDMVNWIIAH
jgi:pimeloyl-ACP methyl ester carboxylesterase